MTSYQLQKTRDALYNIMGNKAYSVPTHLIEAFEVSITAIDPSSIIKVEMRRECKPTVFKILSSNYEGKLHCGHEVHVGDSFYIDDRDDTTIDICLNCGVFKGLPLIATWVEASDLSQYWFHSKPLMVIKSIEGQIKRNQSKGVKKCQSQSSKLKKQQSVLLKREELLKNAIEC